MMDLNKDLVEIGGNKPKFKGDKAIKERFRLLLREGINVASRCGHNMRIEIVKSEKTHIWARLVCKNCGGTLYLDADRKWHKDKIFGMAAMLKCKKKGK
jgi:hypothetical protein